MADIVSFVPGDYTPGAENAVRNAVNVINATWNQTLAKSISLEDKIDAITDEATGWLSTTAAPQVSAATAVAAPVVNEPTITIPTDIDTAMILADYEAEYTKIRALMVTDLSKIITDYFPEDSQTYSAAETWIQAAMANPNGGLPVAVQAQIIADDHARISAEADQASDTLVQTFAARRFPLPPGALASAQLQIHQKEQSLMAESSRKVTILSVEMMKFAVEKALNMRQLAMNATLDYVKTMASAPDVSSRVVGIGYDAQTKLISAVSSFLSARTDVQKLVSSVAEFNVTTAQETKAKNQAADMTMIDNRLKALLAEIQAFINQAVSLYNNLHASAGTSYGVSA